MAETSGYEAALEGMGAEADHAFVWHVARNAGYDKIRSLLEAGANPNAVSRTGWSALFLALLNHDWDIVGLLIDWGVDVNARDEDGDTVMEAAVAASFSEHCPRQIQALLDAGAVVDDGALLSARRSVEESTSSRDRHDRKQVEAMLYRYRNVQRSAALEHAARLLRAVR